MNNIIQMSVHKTSISIKKKNWARLSRQKNRSAIINQALELYYDRYQHIKQAQQQREAESIRKGLEDIERGNITEIILGKDETMHDFLEKL